MPEWLVISLLVVFVIHLVVFARLAVLRGERYYWVVSATFALLVLSFGSRLWLAEVRVGEVPFYWIPRVLAWGCTALAIVLAVRRRRVRRAGNESTRTGS